MLALQSPVVRPVIVPGVAGLVIIVIVMEAQPDVPQVPPSWRTKYVVVRVGETVMVLPVPAVLLPPQVVLYHFQTPPGESVPCTVRTAVLSLHRIFPLTEDVIPEGVHEGAVTEMVMFAQLVVPQAFSALAK